MIYRGIWHRFVTAIVLCLAWSELSSDGSPWERAVRVEIPGPIQSNLFNRTACIAEATYPEANTNWLDGYLRTVFFCREHSIRAIGGTGCELFLWGGEEHRLGLIAEVPIGALTIGGDGPLPGERPNTESSKSVNLDEARRLADITWQRLATSLRTSSNPGFGRESGSSVRFGSADKDEKWAFTCSFKDNEGVFTECCFYVRARDGRVVMVQLKPSWLTLLDKPRMSRDEALRKAQALPGRIEEANLSLDCRTYFAERRLVWVYLPPPVPEGGSMNYGIWDAMTSELLESDCLNGAKPQYRVYRNPEFYFEPTEANVRANLEKNLKKWAEQAAQ